MPPGIPVATVGVGGAKNAVLPLMAATLLARLGIEDTDRTVWRVELRYLGPDDRIERRADAVAQYLLANSPLSSSKVQAVGYGETRPIANNETKEGREKNRRIDVVITQGD